MAERFYSDLEKKRELDITLNLSIGGKCESLPKSRSLPSILSMESWRVKSRKKLKERNIIGSCNREDRMLMGAHHLKSRTTSQQEREQFQQQREQTEGGRKRKEIDAQFSYSNLSPRSFPTMPSFGIPCKMPIPSPLADTQSLPMENTYRPLIERGWPMSSKISSILQGGSKSNSYKSHTLIVDKPQPQSSSNATESKGTDQLASHTAESTLVSNFNAPTPCLIERVTSVNNPPTPPSKDPKRTYGSLTMMPNVTTKGNGPNGKSISGILYRYTKSEVSIVCVCHGSFFSPAEFVEHAGGTNMDHPLKQINVVP